MTDWPEFFRIMVLGGLPVRVTLPPHVAYERISSATDDALNDIAEALHMITLPPGPANTIDPLATQFMEEERAK